MPQLRHFDNLNTARFVTFSCYHRLQLLRTPEAIRLFLESLSEAKHKYRFKLLGFVVMPEHVHLVIHPADGTRLGPLIGEIKSKSASRIIAKGMIRFPNDCRVVRNGRERWAFWQPRCYDHNCRSEATVIEKINYCHKNPVLRGLVSGPEDWRWSSYRWYAGQRDGLLEIDPVAGVSLA